jgi:hypothetical protein
MPRAALRLVGIAVAAAIAACASGTGKRTAVAVVRSQEAVRGCEFLSRLSSPTAEAGAYSEKVLRERVADLGGDTLLAVGGGAAEAWKCGSGGSAKAYADNPSSGATPTPAFRPATPTPRWAAEG